MRRDRERAEARRARLITGAIVAAVVAVVVAAGVAIGYNGRSGTVEEPAGATSVYGFVYSAATIGDNAASNAATPVHVVFYEDFQCPICRAWESEVGSYVDQQVKKGALRVEYRPIAILDSSSTTQYSTRSASAAACVFNDAGAKAFHTFHDLLYESQPPEGGDGLPDSQLIELAGQAGATGVASCISGTDYQNWVTNATDQASQNNVVGTPTILVDGQELTGANGGVPPSRTSSTPARPPGDIGRHPAIPGPAPRSCRIVGRSGVGQGSAAEHEVTRHTHVLTCVVMADDCCEGVAGSYHRGGTSCRRRR